MKNKKIMIASIILSSLTILMLCIIGLGNWLRCPTMMPSIIGMFETLGYFGIPLIINLLLVVYVNKRWMNALYIALMIIVLINELIMFVDSFIITLTVGPQALVYVYGFTLIYLLTIILAITAIVKFVKSKINK